MRIEHLAIWAQDIETLRRFYGTYFHATSSAKYTNPTKGFASYFLTFDTDARLEIMQMDRVEESLGEPGGSYLGFAHMAISAGSKERVDQLTTRLKNDGYSVLDGPRNTGDGYYESVILDPEGNRVEITV